MVVAVAMGLAVAQLAGHGKRFWSRSFAHNYLGNGSLVPLFRAQNGLMLEVR